VIAPNDPAAGAGGGRWQPRVLVLAPRAVKDLARLDATDRQRMADALAHFAATGQGDVKRLTDVRPPAYRLRAGDCRALFALTPERVEVERIVNRRDAY